MKKVIRLTESDLVKIVNKVIEEQKITDKGPVIGQEFNINNDVLKEIDPQNKFKFKPGTKGKYLGNNKIQIGIHTFPITTETGYRVQIFPVSVQYNPNETLKLKFSTEPFGGKYGITSFRLIKDI
jgi:hypothetical protein